MKQRPAYRRPQTKGAKGRKITYVMAVFFGLLGLFVIGKGWRDMQRRIKDFTYFDRIWEPKRDTLFNDGKGNTFRVRAGSVWRGQSRRPDLHALDGTVDFSVQNPVWILTPDSVHIIHGRGRLTSGRFPELWLYEGAVIIGYDTLQGTQLHYRQGKIVR